MSKLLLRFGWLSVLVITLLVSAKITPLRSWLSDFSMPLRHGVYREKNIMVPMRDGIKLATEVYRPLSGNGPFPVILIRTTYGGTDLESNKYFVKNGYIVVVQHVRGRYNSQGDTYSPHRYSRTDGYDTIDWIVKQKWSSGKVGTLGCSYLGESQIMLAAEKHPNHIAMIAGGAGGAIGKAKDSFGYFGIYENGVLNLASALGWFTAAGATEFKTTQRPTNYKEKMQTEMGGLPVVKLATRIVPYKTGFEDFVLHELTASWWDEEGYISNQDSFSTATLHVNSWYDQTVQDTFLLAEQMSKNSDHPRAKAQHIIIDPGVHCGAGKLREGLVRVGEMEFQYKDPDFKRIYIDWFDHWLKGKETELPPRFKYFLIHGDRWQTSNQWPPKNVKSKRLYLHEEGLLVTSGPQELPKRDFDRFLYNPLDPVPTIGGPICCTYRENDIAGALDQNILKSRDDVLIFTSEKLESDIDLIGNVNATLFVSTTAKDTDFTVKIVDLYPDGKAYNLQDGVKRLRYREGIDRAILAEAGEIYQIDFVLRPIAYRFKKGHRISVYISSSNFPRLARNLNTGKEEYINNDVVIAENSIYRSSKFPSHIDFPFVSE